MKSRKFFVFLKCSKLFAKRFELPATGNYFSYILKQDFIKATVIQECPGSFLE